MTILGKIFAAVIVLTAACTGSIRGQESTMGRYLSVARQMEGSMLDAAAISPGTGGKFDTLLIGFDEGRNVVMQVFSASNRRHLYFYTIFKPKEELDLVREIESAISSEGILLFDRVDAHEGKMIVSGIVTKFESETDIVASILDILRETRGLYKWLDDSGYSYE